MFCFKLTSHSCFPVTDKYLKLRKKINEVCNGAGEKKSQRNPRLKVTLTNEKMTPMYKFGERVIVTLRLWETLCIQNFKA